MPTNPQPDPSPQAEIMYHVFERSFYDSDGDRHGDLQGLRQQLSYLEELGVNALLVTPLFRSGYYHNYFADDFGSIDPRYGTMEDWVALVRDLHSRGMRIYLDMEIQYVTDRQIWFRESYRNPASRYSDYILYNGPGNTEPEPIIYNLSRLIGYNNTTRKMATVNLLHPDVQAYFLELFLRWMDPAGTGRPEDGVDGFRIDHMMDDLDDKGVLSGLFDGFWRPLFTRLKARNPGLCLIAEQGNWEAFGGDYFERAGVDRVFAFNLQRAFLSFNKAAIAATAAAGFAETPPGCRQIVIIENHDTPRFAAVVDRHPGRLRMGAAFTLLSGGVPCIYYGQELGMFGRGGFGRPEDTDGNDIPQREAFQWYAGDEGPGMAFWYRDGGPWWDEGAVSPPDGVSLEEERSDEHSLWHFYRRLIRLYRERPLLHAGAYLPAANDNGQVYTFFRYTGQQAALVLLNLSEEPQEAFVTLDGAPAPLGAGELLSLYGLGEAREEHGGLRVRLDSYGIALWQEP